MNLHFELRQDRRLNRMAGCLASVLLVMAAAAPATAQSVLTGDLGMGHLRGFRLYNVSAFSTWQSVATPNNRGLLESAGRLGSDLSYGGEATLGWSHPGARSNVSLVYTSTYMGRVRYSEWNALNHALRLNASRRLNARWDMGFSLSSVISNYENLLFSPTLYTSVASIGGTFDDLAAALLEGKFTNDQLASLLTGAPIVESPARTLLFGNRVFNSAATIHLGYTPSPRLTVHWSGGASRLQHLGDPNTEDGGRYPYVLPKSTYASAGLGFNYAVSPHTTLGIDASANRSFSPYSQAYYSTVTGSLGRTFGRHWITRVHAGTGFITPLNNREAQTTKAVGGATLGYKMAAQTFLASYARTVGDVYGAGAKDSVTITGGWNWWRPGRSWGLNSAYTRQDIRGGVLSGVHGWRASLGLSRMMGRHAMLQTSYSYGSFVGTYFNGPYGSDQHSVRLSLVWSPQPMGRR